MVGGCWVYTFCCTPLTYIPSLDRNSLRSFRFCSVCCGSFSAWLPKSGNAGSVKFFGLPKLRFWKTGVLARSLLFLAEPSVASRDLSKVAPTNYPLNVCRFVWALYCSGVSCSPSLHTVLKDVYFGLRFGLVPSHLLLVKF